MIVDSIGLKNSKIQVIRETENKNTRRYHLNPARRAFIKKTKGGVPEYVEKRDPLHTVGENVN